MTVWRKTLNVSQGENFVKTRPPGCISERDSQPKTEEAKLFPKGVTGPLDVYVDLYNENFNFYYAIESITTRCKVKFGVLMETGTTSYELYLENLNSRPIRKTSKVMWSNFHPVLESSLQRLH